MAHWPQHSSECAALARLLPAHHAPVHHAPVHAPVNHAPHHAPVHHAPVHALHPAGAAVPSTPPHSGSKRLKVDRTPKMKKVASAVSQVDVPSPSSAAPDAPSAPNMTFVNGIPNERKPSRRNAPIRRNKEAVRKAKSAAALEAEQMQVKEQHVPISLSDVERFVEKEKMIFVSNWWIESQSGSSLAE
jgi:hypothetical protein